MSEESYSLYELVSQDPRYPVEAYLFVREALAYAADSAELTNGPSGSGEADTKKLQCARRERHLTGQQLCEAIRLYSINQFGYMAKTVLGNWGITETSCFGDIVYNMIRIGIMKKSSRDRRSHFDNVYNFVDAFEKDFEICCNSISRHRS